MSSSSLSWALQQTRYSSCALYILLRLAPWNSQSKQYAFQPSKQTKLLLFLSLVSNNIEKWSWTNTLEQIAQLLTLKLQIALFVTNKQRRRDIAFVSHLLAPLSIPIRLGKCSVTGLSLNPNRLARAINISAFPCIQYQELDQLPKSPIPRRMGCV